MRKNILTPILFWLNAARNRWAELRHRATEYVVKAPAPVNYIVKHTGLTRAERRSIEAQIDGGKLSAKQAAHLKRLYIQSDFNEPYVNELRTIKKAGHIKRFERRLGYRLKRLAILEAAKNFKKLVNPFAGRGVIQVTQ